ncbi:hypothetical protein WR25_25648 isoform B [Diploscapter pachys]|uniref:NTF2 domain-containing protein n=1 Tax=Diploscapter pachys TaxID=2018661 RepID=A0A2A2KLE0_9BILA|nr:hypothetical protein WR25_25648 isoform B [Diploscapter pachys]
MKMSEMTVEEQLKMLKLGADYGKAAPAVPGGVQNTNGRQISEKVHIENAEEIGKEFVKEFYNCVAVKPSEAYRFFSHESIALLEDGRPFGGQVEIGNEIERRFADQFTKFQIYSIKSVPSSAGGIVVQVCGKRNEAPFVETFVLAQQTAKKFYVFSDILQMVDVAFDEKRRTAAMMQKVSEVVVNNANAAHIIDKIVPQNGHSQPNYDDLNQVAHPEEKPKLDDHSAHREKSSAHPTPTKDELQPRKKTISNSEPQDPAPQTPSEPPKPRTWANLVGGNQDRAPQQQQQQRHQTPHSDTSAPKDQLNTGSGGGEQGAFSGRGRDRDYPRDGNRRGGAPFRGRGGSGSGRGGNFERGERRGGFEGGRGNGRGGGFNRDRDNNRGGYNSDRPHRGDREGTRIRGFEK